MEGDDGKERETELAYTARLFCASDCTEKGLHCSLESSNWFFFLILKLLSDSVTLSGIRKIKIIGDEWQ